MTSGIRTNLKHADRSVFYELARTVVNLVQRTKFTPSPEGAQRSDCWILDGKIMQVRIKGRGGKKLNIRNVAYEAAFGEAESQSFASACGNDRCFNPDHLVDEMWGWWEDFSWLIECGVSPDRIQERLNTTHEDIWMRTTSTKDPKRRAAGRQYIRASLEARLGSVDCQEGEMVIKALRARLTTLDDKRMAA